MIDFKKKLTSKSTNQKTNPIEIYDSLDRASDKGPLRPAQEEILKEWFENNIDKKDVIIKLHTGQGKTLIGLLILQSKLNQLKKPVMFICPNKHLAEQTCEQAKQFGINYCKIEDNNNIPNDFFESKAILISHVHLVFNGLSKFGIGNRFIEVGAIVLDDSHACIEQIENSVTIRIPKDDDIFAQFIQLFEGDLELQGAAKLEEIKNGEYETILPVPYSAWTEKNRAVIKLLLKSNEQNYIKFPWELIKDDIENCRCIVSANRIEITPYRIPIGLFGTFHNCKCRILMSATTNNDSFFIKGLGIDKNTILNPLVYSKEKWSGEKMVLIPNDIRPELDRNAIISTFANKNTNRKFGIVGLTPSFRHTNIWEEKGAKIANTLMINDCIEDYKKGDFANTIVFVNRYDGIDLPDKMCRILILDSLPNAQSLFDQYQEKCRKDCSFIEIKIAQKIEQGMGRGVRGEKDYCVIIIATPDLINIVRNSKIKKYFSEQTNKQIEIGIEVTKMASEDATTDNSKDILISVINQALTRDEGWKNYYKEEMDTINIETKDSTILDMLELEKKAEDSFFDGQFENAKNTIQGLIDKFILREDDYERGWYMQEMARMIYPVNKTESNNKQVIAHKCNRALLKPLIGMEFKKLEMNGARIQNIKDELLKYNNYTDFMAKLNKLKFELAFGVSADKFENALFEIGLILGFGSERPDNDWKQEPDNLWNISRNEYILFECKNEVLESRTEINKAETGQMNNACAWFKTNYAGVSIKNVMIIPTKVISPATGFNEPVVILRKQSLSKLKKNITAFVSEFKEYDIKNLSDEQIHKSLKSNKLLETDILSEYFEVPTQKKM